MNMLPGSMEKSPLLGRAKAKPSLRELAVAAVAATIMNGCASVNGAVGNVLSSSSPDNHHTEHVVSKEKDHGDETSKIELLAAGAMLQPVSLKHRSAGEEHGGEKLIGAGVVGVNYVDESSHAFYGFEAGVDQHEVTLFAVTGKSLPLVGKKGKGAQWFLPDHLNLSGGPGVVVRYEGGATKPAVFVAADLQKKLIPGLSVFAGVKAESQFGADQIEHLAIGGQGGVILDIPTKKNTKKSAGH